MHTNKSITRILTLFFLLSASPLLAEYKQDKATDGNSPSKLLEEYGPENNPMVDVGFVKGGSVGGNISNTTMIGVNYNIEKHCQVDHSRCNLNKFSEFPNPVKYFQERKEESRAVHDTLSSKRNSEGVDLVCIVGFSGSGKTQLATKYAKDHKSDYHHVRFFDASDSKKLFDDFKLFAFNIHLYREDLLLCYTKEGKEVEDCFIEAVKDCLKEVAQDFLWIFDNVREYKDVERYILDKDNINGVILLTSKNKKFVECGNDFIDLSGGMKTEEGSALLSKAIAGTGKPSDVSDICSDEEIKDIATGIWNNLPVYVSQTGEIIRENGKWLGGCKGYLEILDSDPHGIKSLSDDKEAAFNNLRFLNKVDLEIVGLLSFIESPFSRKLVVSYVYHDHVCRSALGLPPLDNIKRDKKTKALDEMKIQKAIDNIFSVKESDGLLSFPHELFCENAQLFLLEKDELEPGSYKALFDRMIDFLCQNFSGHFWDDEKWDYEKNFLLSSVKQIIDSFIIKDYELEDEEKFSDRKVIAGEKLQPFNDSYLVLADRLARFYIEEKPLHSIKLFNFLLDTIESRSEVENDLFEYSKNSINHAVIAHSLAVAYCQAWYKNEGDIDLTKVEVAAKSAYALFEEKLGKNNPKTLNAYLTLAHIKINLQGNKTAKSVVKFSGKEPIVEAALVLSGLQPGSKSFNELKDVLSGLNVSLLDKDYLTIYSTVAEKMDVGQYKNIQLAAT